MVKKDPPLRADFFLFKRIALIKIFTHREKKLPLRAQKRVCKILYKPRKLL